MLDNTVKANNNVDIYEHKIYQIFDNYVSRLSDDPEESNRMIRNVRYFKGALKCIYTSLFRPETVYDMERGTYNPSILDINDLELLDGLWSIYCNLCYEYGIKPTVMQYCIMTGLNHDTVTHWGSYNPEVIGNLYDYGRDPSNAKRLKYNLSKSWLKEQESALFDGASSGSVGDIFLLKSVYNYRDNTTITVDNESEDGKARQAALTADLVRRLTSSPDGGIHGSTSPTQADSVAEYTQRVDIIPPDF